jgi:hypothetical protein
MEYKSLDPEKALVSGKRAAFIRGKSERER